MTSKISFFKLIREDIKNRSWLLALTALALFIVQPVALMISLGNRTEELKNHYITMEQVMEYYQGQVGFGNGAIIFVLMFVALVCAFTGYQYLHSRVKLDFYHSLSIKRPRLFFVRYCSGFLIYAVPAFVCTILSLAVGGVNGLFSCDILYLTLKAFVIHLLYFLLIYATAILAMMMTGKIIVAFLAFGVFASYGIVVSLIASALVTRFFRTAIYDGSWIDKLNSYFSPISFCMNVEGKLASEAASVGSKWLCVGILIVSIIALTLICLGVYTIRKTEAAEHSMAFPKTEGIIKVLVVVPLSIGIGFYVSMMVANNPLSWLLAGVVFGAIILSALMEFIYHMDIREVFHHKIQILVSVILAVGIVLAFRFDVFGFDSYIPDKEDISAMAVYYDPINGSYAYKIEVTQSGSASYYGEKYALDECEIQDFDPIYALAEEGVSLVKNQNQEGQRIAVKYELKSGRSVYRAYVLPSESVDREMEKLYDREDFKRAIYPLYREEEREIDSITLTTWNGGRVLTLTEAQRKELVDVFKEDLLQTTYQEILQDGQIATMDIVFVDKSVDSYGMTESYPIMESCKNTIALLQEYGYEVPKTADAKQVSSINVEIYQDQNGNGNTVTFTDPDEIQQILDEMKYSCFVFNTSVGSEKEYGYSVSINFDNSADSLWGYFLAGKVPKIVEERLGLPPEEEAQSQLAKDGETSVATTVQ